MLLYRGDLFTRSCDNEYVTYIYIYIYVYIYTYLYIYKCCDTHETIGQDPATTNMSHIYMYTYIFIYVGYIQIMRCI